MYFSTVFGFPNWGLALLKSFFTKIISRSILNTVSLWLVQYLKLSIRCLPFPPNSFHFRFSSYFTPFFLAPLSLRHPEIKPLLTPYESSTLWTFVSTGILIVRLPECLPQMLPACLSVCLSSGYLPLGLAIKLLNCISVGLKGLLNVGLVASWGNRMLPAQF